MQSDSYASFQRSVGGIKSGYGGHVPLALSRAEQPQFRSHFGAFADAKPKSERVPTVRDKDMQISTNVPTNLGAHSMPGYCGHRRGHQDYFGSSFWRANVSSPIADQRRVSQQPPKHAPRQWRMTTQRGDGQSRPDLTPRNTHVADASTRTIKSAPTPFGLTPRNTHVVDASLAQNRISTSASATALSARGQTPTPESQTLPQPAAGTTTGAPQSARGKACFKEGPQLSQRASTPRKEAWMLTSGDHGRAAPEPGSTKQPGPSLREFIGVTKLRDPDEVALKARQVKRITTPLQGRADTWVPPAGLYIENSKKGLNQNLWDLTTDNRHKGPAPEVARGSQFELPNERDPEVVALKAKHVRMITKNLRGDAKTWKPPAGIYLENSKGGLGHNMWDLLRKHTLSGDAVAASTIKPPDITQIV